MKILVINGPNINIIGIRDPAQYGGITYSDLIKTVRSYCESRDCQTDFYQSNHEGDLVDVIQSAYGKYDAIIINPAAYTHTSIAIHDALEAVGIPTVEVHISNIKNREEFRSLSYVSKYASKTIIGKGIKGYLEAVDFLIEKIN